MFYSNSLSEISSLGKISICGFLSTSLFAILRSNDNNSDGSKIKLASIASNNVAETNVPKATVPPKLDIANTENPKNNTIEV